MNFEINFLDNKVIVTFCSKTTEDEVKDAFLYIVDNVSIQKLKHILFDHSKTTEIEIAKDFLKTIQTFTMFLQTWNPNINVITITTNKKIISVSNEVIKNRENLNILWDFMLFDTLDEAIDWCNLN